MTSGLMSSVIQLSLTVWWSLANGWRAAKDVVESHSLVGNEAMHVAVGVLIFALAAWYFRGQRYRWIAAWTFSLALACANEVVDVTVERWPEFEEQVREGAVDLGLTMALPTLFLLMVIWKRWFPVQRHLTTPNAESAESEVGAED